MPVFGLDIGKQRFDDIADRNQTHQLFILQNRHVAEAVDGHELHHILVPSGLRPPFRTGGVTWRAINTILSKSLKVLYRGPDNPPHSTNTNTPASLRAQP